MFSATIPPDTLYRLVKISSALQQHSILMAVHTKKSANHYPPCYARHMKNDSESAAPQYSSPGDLEEDDRQQISWPWLKPLTTAEYQLFRATYHKLVSIGPQEETWHHCPSLVRGCNMSEGTYYRRTCRVCVIVPHGDSLVISNT